MYSYKNEPAFTRLTMETSYGTKVTIDCDHADISADDAVQMFYTAMVGLTFNENSIAGAMDDFVKNKKESWEYTYGAHDKEDSE